MNDPLVSIIVPVYNVETYVEPCIISLLSQDYSNLEIIAVNDGSTDGSLQILEKLSSHDSRLKIISKRNEGVSAARNQALKHVQGDFIMFVDADDWLDLNTLSRCVASIQFHQADVCMFTYMREFDGRSNPKYLFDSDKVFDKEECRQLQRRMIGPIGPELSNPGMLDSYGTIWGKLYRKNVLKDIQFVDLSIIGTAEDTLFNCNVFLNVRKAIYVNQPFYHYRKYNSGSETKKYKPCLYQQWNKLFDYMESVAIGEIARKALYNRQALCMLGLGLNECMSDKSIFYKRKQIKIILNQKHIKESYSYFNFSYFPFYWKVYFLSAKFKAYIIFILLSKIILQLINKTK